MALLFPDLRHLDISDSRHLATGPFRELGMRCPTLVRYTGCARGPVCPCAQTWYISPPRQSDICIYDVPGGKHGRHIVCPCVRGPFDALGRAGCVGRFGFPAVALCAEAPGLEGVHQGGRRLPHLHFFVAIKVGHVCGGEL